MKASGRGGAAGADAVCEPPTRGTLRFAGFVGLVLGVWTAMNVYAGLRLLELPFLAGPPRRALVALLLLGLAAAFPLGRILARRAPGPLSGLLESAGSLWFGALFLLVVCLLAADLVAASGRLAPGPAAKLRRAALLVAPLLALAAALQGRRAPRLREEEVRLPGLPAALEGTTLVQLSDLHLGSLLGARWLRPIVDRTLALAPDLVVLTGDIVDQRPDALAAVGGELARLRAPLGVFAVTGNHEFYAGLEASVGFLERAGLRVLRDASRSVAPGLVLAGVDDLTARRQMGLGGDPLGRALADRPPGATLLLCHSPLRVAEARALGVGLMLSGHTHGGQIWPFGLIVGRFYPEAADRRDFPGFTLIVCRGTGTWGPRMRLFRRSEIVRVRLLPALRA